MFNNFNRNILILFITVTLSGALRKWIIDNSIVNLLLTGLGLTSAAIFFYFQRKNDQKLVNKGFIKILSVFTFYLIICAVNPLNQTIFHGIVGIIIHLSFWTAIFLFIDNAEKYDFWQTKYYIIVISAIQIGIAILQYTSPSDSVWNTLKGNSSMAMSDSAIQNDALELEGDSFKNQAYVGEGTRATGTFSYLGGYYAYMIFHMLFTFSLFIKKASSHLCIAMFFIGFLGVLLNGSRSLFIVFIIINFAFFIFQLKKPRAILSGALLLFTLIFVNYSFNDFLNIGEFTSNAVDNLLYRLEQNEEEGKGRINAPLESLISYDGEYPIFGVGLGATYPGINSIFGASHFVTKHAYEQEIGRTIQDGGYILLIFKLVLYIILIRKLALNRVFSSVLFGILFFGTLITTNPFLSFYLLIGIIFLDKAIRETSQQ